eukprot:TRINITY_DN11953_c1_g2_i2.p1 TRINITY_DN11953_c1_g2~~TRINITY_DN11953_c1_g2_i2.p1  ORF type:complete len:434 (+),score=101.50 TRINITY_DN11953_c1_g2_i2:39-1304(+)
MIKTEKERDALEAEKALHKEGDFVVVNGLRYVVPHLSTHSYAVRDKNAGTSVLELLADVFRKHRGEQDIDESRKHWRDTIEGGRVKLKRHKLRRDDVDKYTENFCVVGCDHILQKQDRLQIVSHMHERVVGGGTPQVLVDDGRFVIINKPACIPCVSGENGFNNIVDITARHVGAQKLHLLHRLDSPVSGILLLARGGKQARLGLQELAGRRARKVYLAKVEGRFPDRPVSCTEPLYFCSKLDRSVVRPMEAGAKAATTHFRLAHFNEAEGVSIVEASPVSGLRHQIRAHLAHLGVPIVNDVRYGAKKRFEGQTVYQDDDLGTLKRISEGFRRPWCGKCGWVDSVMGNEHHSVVPKAESHICLHAMHYEIPALKINVTGPLPPWAEAELPDWTVPVSVPSDPEPALPPAESEPAGDQSSTL